MEPRSQTTVSQKQLNLVQLQQNLGNELKSSAEENTKHERVISSLKGATGGWLERVGEWLPG